MSGGTRDENEAAYRQMLADPALRKAMSGYGPTNGYEAAAEGFAEYATTDGGSKNVAARHYAKLGKYDAFAQK